jgi:hypothetical protein
MIEHIKVYTGTAIMVNKLAFLLEEKNISVIVKNPIESGLIVGFASPVNAVELYILNTDVEEAASVIEVFKSKMKY